MLIFKIQKIMYPFIWFLALLGILCVGGLVVLPVSQVIHVSGEMQAFEDYSITSQVDGYIKEVHAASWDEVKKGQPVLTLSNPDLLMETYREYSRLLQSLDQCLPLKESHEREQIMEELYSKLNSNDLEQLTRTFYNDILPGGDSTISTLINHEQASLKKSYEAEYKTYLKTVKLSEANQIAPEEYEEAKKRFELIKAEYFNSMKKMINDYNLTKLTFFDTLQKVQALHIVSPGDGFLEADPENCVVGTYVKKGMPLCRVRSNKIKAVIHVPQRYSGEIRQGQKVIIYLNGYNDKKFGLLSGELDKIAPVLINHNGEPYLHCSLILPFNTWPDRALLKSGMFFDARIDLGSKKIYRLIFDAMVGN